MPFPFSLNIVLIEPQIPPNTGSIGRLCLATGTTLHLVEPLGFEITHAKLRRAGLDYWEHLNVQVHASTEEFFKKAGNAPMVFFSKKAKKNYLEFKYEPGTYLIFGKETLGLSDEILTKHADQCALIPIYDERVRSLNLANAASIALYEAIRQLGV